MAMLDMDSRSLPADSQPKSDGLVGSSVGIRQMNRVNFYSGFAINDTTINIVIGIIRIMMAAFMRTIAKGQCLDSGRQDMSMCVTESMFVLCCCEVPGISQSF